MPRFALVRAGAWPGLLLGLGLGLLVLGPGLGRGFLLSYDMVFVPREPFSAALPGLAPPRAVPSDLVVAAASRVLPGDIVQKLVLLAIFVLGCGGVAALLDREPVLARLAAGVFFSWNPYVGERLIIGQWALLLGYAGLPWVLRAVLDTSTLHNGSLHISTVTWRWVGRVCLAMVPAIAGGFESMVITALVAVPAVLCTRSVSRSFIVFDALLVGSLPWLIPSLTHRVYVDPASVAAFAARPDTPFGSVGSLVMLGGIWNSRAVPKAYGGAVTVIWLGIVLIALAGFYVNIRWQRGQERWAGLGFAAALGLLIACAGVSGPGRDLLKDLIRIAPGVAVFRDGQQFVAPLALAGALGAGTVVAWAMNPGFSWSHAGKHERPGSADAAGVMLGAFALLAPVLLLPGLAWGAAGRLRPVQYPAAWLAAAQVINRSAIPGAVLVLPWAAERTPSWNHGETMLDPWPRLLSRQVIWNDGTIVGSISLTPDDPKARQLDGVIDGQGPLTAALTAAGVRFVLSDPDEPGQQVGGRLPGAVVMISQPGLTVYRLPV